MSEIINYNFNGLCNEKYCNKKYTHVYPLKMGDIEFILPLCLEHYDKLADIKYLEDLK